MIMSKAIVKAVRSMNPPGRFLERSFVTGLWYDVGDGKAVEKTSQTLREKSFWHSTKESGKKSSDKRTTEKKSADLDYPDFLSFFCSKP